MGKTRQDRRAISAYIIFMSVYPFSRNTLEGETWKWVKDYDGIYKISNYSRIKSYQKRTEKIIKPALSESGYLYVCLSKFGEHKHFRLHRLVAQAFVPNPDNLPEVDHINGDKLNCTATNLRYVSHRENIHYAREMAYRKHLEDDNMKNIPAQVFNNEEFGEIRVLGDWENPLFCLADVCRALELGNPSQVKSRLEDGVISNEVIFDSLGRKQNAVFVNEDGLYDVILDSRKPEAKKFRKWITSEVLPTIRKTGGYLTPEKLNELFSNPDAIIKLCQEWKAALVERDQLRNIVDMQAVAIAELTPKASYYDLILQSTEALPISVIAKDYGYSGCALNKLLNEMQIPRYGSAWLGAVRQARHKKDIF